VQIRPAEVADASRIAEVHVRSWQSAYRGLMPQEYLDGLRPAHRTPMWERITSRCDGLRSGVLVAETESCLRGFAAFGPTRDADGDPVQTGEIGAIYLAPDAWGAGCGRALMAAALERLSAAGYRQVTLWVLDTNARARKFYKAAGFRPDGAEKLDAREGLELMELRYRRPLA
jgi:ribosomal protein S18 acetylase RimI-like enzyme